MQAPFKSIAFGPTLTHRQTNADGTIQLWLDQPLNTYPEKLSEKLYYWAETQPDRTFLARRDQSGQWQRLSYAETLRQVRAVAQYLLNLGLSPTTDTLVILSENSLEHALLALAAMHIGLPYAPISPPYSLVSTDMGRLTHCLQQMAPSVIFAQDGQSYARALALAASLFPDSQLITATPDEHTLFSDLLQTAPTEAVEQAWRTVTAQSVAKILFTSGSTGSPKGVINTHGMWCANLQQITQVFPFMATEPPVFIDWLPWHHTFGGNHNVGLALYNGGTLYIDDGKPTPAGIETTVRNLREIAPTVYFNVPKGFEMLIPFFEQEPNLRDTFFSRLHMLFYAGASLAQPIWNRWESLAAETIGERIPIITGLGCTESGPSAMFANWGGSFSGLLGVPVAGMTVKLVPDGDKLEARYKAPNVTPGYWRNEEATRRAFDEEGYYKTGDAVKFRDETDPSQGLVFDGRIAEDFKLSTGTWVNVGILRMKLLTAGTPLVQDAVLTGLDQDYVGAILFLNPDACRALSDLPPATPLAELVRCATIQNQLEQLLTQLHATARGSADRLEKVLITLQPPSIDKGEITDKGSLNQRAILANRPHLIKKLYESQPNRILYE